MGKSRQFSIEPGQVVSDSRSQHDRFVDMARELGCDENEAAFDEKLKVVARQKAKVDVKPTKATKSD